MCVGVWRRSTRGSPGAHRGEAAGCWRAALGIPRRAGARGGFAWSCPQGADLGAALPALMAKPLAQPQCGGAPRRTNASDSAAGESGAGKKGRGWVALTHCALTPGPKLYFIFVASLGSPGVLVVREEEGGFVRLQRPREMRASACEAAAAAAREAAEPRCSAGGCARRPQLTPPPPPEAGGRDPSCAKSRPCRALAFLFRL